MKEITILSGKGGTGKTTITAALASVAKNAVYCDNDVDGSDAQFFKTDFGRSPFLNPCTGSNPCNGDFDCDVDVDGTDARVFKDDFGRSGFKNPCPPCDIGIWCSYQ